MLVFNLLVIQCGIGHSKPPYKDSLVIPEVSNRESIS